MLALSFPFYDFPGRSFHTVNSCVSLYSLECQVGLLPLRAAIAGGSLLQVASISPLTLDASGSRDLDVAPTLDQVSLQNLEKDSSRSCLLLAIAKKLQPSRKPSLSEGAVSRGG